MAQRLGWWAWRCGLSAAILGAAAVSPLPAQSLPMTGTYDDAGVLPTVPGAAADALMPMPAPVQRVYGSPPTSGLLPPSGVAVDAYYYPYSGVNGFETGVNGYGVVRPYPSYYSTARPAYFQPYNYYGSNYGSYYRPGLFGFAWYSPVYAPNSYNAGLNSPFSYSTGPYNGSGYLAPNDVVDPNWRY